MKTVWKFPLLLDDLVMVRMPTGAQVLCAQAQGDKPFLWALVDAGVPTYEDRLFRVAGTGHRLWEDDAQPGRHVGTFQLLAGAFVGHVFEMTS